MQMPVPDCAKFVQPGYRIWGASMIRDDQGICHVYYSRWPSKFPFNAWVSHSEIAHAISDDPLGPYEFTDVSLPARGTPYWDGMCTHNPTVHRFDGKYYIYYMGNTGNLAVVDDPNDLNWIHRNHQRIGVAAADSPYGPWRRKDSPLIDISDDQAAPDSLCVSNPSVTQKPDGNFLMVYKAIGKKRPLPFGGPVVHRIAEAEHPTGPFTKRSESILTVENNDFPAEDPFLWYQDDEKLYYIIIKDMGGTFIGKGKTLALFCSENGYEWKLAENPIASDLMINWQSGQERYFRLERPQLWLHNGQPAVLFVAVMRDDGSTFFVTIPLKSDHETENPVT